VRLDVPTDESGDRARAVLLKTVRRHVRETGGKAIGLHRELKRAILKAKKSTGKYPPDVVKRMKDVNQLLKALEGLDKAIEKALGQ